MLRARLTAGLLVILVMGLGAAPAQEAAPLPGWGEPIDPDGDCTIRLDGPALTIAVPGTPHDLRPDAGLRNAPRVLRDVEGNHAARVRISGNLAPGGTAPEGDRAAGLLLWQDQRNFLRVGLRSGAGGPDGLALQVEYWKDGQLQALPDGPAALPDLSGEATWLRQTRRLNRVRVEFSTDGEQWTEVLSLPVRLPSRLRLGPIASNTTTEPLEARFESFEVRSVSLYP